MAVGRGANLLVNDGTELLCEKVKDLGTGDNY